MREQREQHPEALKQEVGLWLQSAPRGSQRIMANLLEVSDRTLRSWKKDCHRPRKRRGRKKISLSLSEQLAVAREWKRQAYPGARPVIKALPKIRVRVVRAVVAALKVRKKKRYELKRKEMRVSVSVKQIGAVMSMDAATAQKGEEFIVYRDRGSLSVRSQKCRGHTTSGDTLDVLEGIKKMNCLPLVLCTDNGSPFCNKMVDDFMLKNCVIHLRSLPRVPQHNGSAENAVQDFKKSLKDGMSPEVACTRLNQNRKRQTLGWQTSNEAEQSSLVLYTQEQRERFFNAANAAIRTAVLGTETAYEKRKAEREAILRTMESFSLITITRGQRQSSVKPEEIT